MADTHCLLHNCLYFSANALARALTRLAEEAFAPTGLAPTHAFLLMLVVEQPGITPSTLAGHLHLAPSTVTRLVDALIYKQLLEKRPKGKASHIFPTKAGKELLEHVAKAWKSIYLRYSEILGEQAGNDLAQAINAACERLGQA